MRVTLPNGVTAEQAGVPVGFSDLLNFVNGTVTLNLVTGALDIVAGGVTWPLRHSADEAFQPNGENADTLLLHANPGWLTAGGLPLFVNAHPTFQNTQDGSPLLNAIEVGVDGLPLYLTSVGGSMTLNSDGGPLLLSSFGGPLHIDSGAGPFLLTSTGPMTVDLDTGALTAYAASYTLNSVGFDAQAIGASGVLAVAADTSGAIPLASSTDGISWTPNTNSGITFAFGWAGLVWAAALNLFVLVSRGGLDSVWTSADGLGWVGHGTIINFGRDVAYAPTLGVNGVLVMVGDGPDTIASSPDGVVWTAQGDPFGGGSGRSVVWADTLALFVAIGVDGGGAGVVATSPDGAIWTAHGDPFAGTAGPGQNHCLAWSAALGLLVTVGAAAQITVIATSPDGTAWTLRPATWAKDGGPNAVVWSPSRGDFELAMQVGVLNPPDVVSASSPDGVTWTANPNPFAYGDRAGSIKVLAEGLGHLLGWGAPGTSSPRPLRDYALQPVVAGGPTQIAAGGGIAFQPDGVPNTALNIVNTPAAGAGLQIEADAGDVFLQTLGAGNLTLTPDGLLFLESVFGVHVDGLFINMVATGSTSDISMNATAVAFQLDGAGHQILLGGPAGATLLTVSPADAGRGSPDEVFYSRLTTVPRAADLPAGAFAFWLDDTIGATKLNIMGKDSGGTVRAAVVPLL